MTAITISSRARRLVCRYERWMPTLPGGPRTPLSYVGALSPLRSPSLSRHTPAASLRPRPRPRQLPNSGAPGFIAAIDVVASLLTPDEAQSLAVFTCVRCGCCARGCQSSARACRVDRAVVGMRPAACCPQETAHAHARQMQAVSPCRWNNLRHKFPNEYKFPLN